MILESRTEFTRQVTRNLLELMCQDERSNAEICRLAGLNPLTSYSWSREARVASAYTIYRICHVLNRDVREVFPNG
ncbi:MAG: hypothetical protein HC841_00450 [Verrucomicrobiae bacterium]|nr:hypothetical protein [Verrucomicrobiae bacterium]